MQLNTIAEAVDDLRRGRLVIVVDDTDRENEGDLIMAAETATTAQIAFMVRHTSGILCVPMEADRAERLNLTPMVANNLDPFRTAFTVSVDYRPGMTTGIAAEERANTARALADADRSPGEFLRPGHMFPLIARAGGVLSRSGHTEAAIDLARLAGLEPVGVLAEVVNDDGTVKRLPELLAFAAEHGLKIVSIEDLIQHRIRNEHFVERLAERPITIGSVEATAAVYRTPLDPMQHMAVVFGDLGDGRDVLCRIHREQPLQDLLNRVCARPTWLDAPLDILTREGRGVLVVLRGADAEEAGDTAPTSGETGTGEWHGSARARVTRWREVGVGAQILRHLGVRSIALIASREQRYVGLGGFDIEITRTVVV